MLPFQDSIGLGRSQLGSVAFGTNQLDCWGGKVEWMGKTSRNPFDGLLKLVVGMRCGKNLRCFFEFDGENWVDLESRALFFRQMS